MIREVELAQYLPPYIKEYREPAEALKAEDPEFDLQWEASERVFRNRFILSADEAGMEQYETMLGIFPSSGDTLENRRMRVLARWNQQLPYTLRRLGETLQSLFGEEGYRIEASKLADYQIGITLINQDDPMVQTVKDMMAGWLPVSLVLYLQSCLAVRKETNLTVGAGRWDYICIRAMPESLNSVLEASAQVKTGAGVIAYYRADYRPGAGRKRGSGDKWQGR